MKQRHLDALYVSFAQNLKDFEPISAVRPDATSNQLGTATSAAGNVVTNLLEDMVDFAQGSLIIHHFQFHRLLMESLSLGTQQDQ
jgi:hypothetical protein